MMPSATPGGNVRRDLLAGIGTGLFTIPQAMAFALLAGLPPAAGLRTAVAAGAVAALFGSSPHLWVSTNNAVCVVVGGILLGLSGTADPVLAAAMLALLVGVYLLAFAALRLGNLTQFVSHSVLQGFTLGAAILIVLGQVGTVLGVEVERHWSVLLTASRAVERIGETNGWALAVAAVAFLCTRGLARRADRIPIPLLTVLLCAAASWVLDLPSRGVASIGRMPLDLKWFEFGPETLELARDLLVPALAVALLATIQTLSISKSLGVLAGRRVDANREILGIGLGNLASGLARGLPAAGSFGGSAVNYRGGARTRMAALVSSVVVLVVTLVAAPLGDVLPKAALGGMLVGIALGIPNREHLRTALRATRSDAAVMIATCVATLTIPIDRAIYLGIGLSLVLYLRKARSPYLRELLPDEAGGFREVAPGTPVTGREVILLHLEGDLFFAAADVLEEELAAVTRDPALRVLVLRMKSARNLDATSALVLHHLARRIRASGRHLLIAGAGPVVMGILDRTGVIAAVGRENVFPDTANVLAATAQAMERARVLAGEKADIRVLYDTSGRG